MSILKIYTCAVACIALISSAAFADNSIRIGGIQMTGGGLQLVGTISTTTADSNNKTLEYVGWTLIVVGSLVNGGDVAMAAEYDLSGEKVWDSVIREASVLERAPQLARPDMAISSAAAQLDLTVEELSGMALSIDRTVKISESNGTLATSSSLQARLFPEGFKNEKQSAAFANMTALATMK